MKKVLSAGAVVATCLSLTVGSAWAGYTVPAKVQPVQQAPAKDKDKDDKDKKDKKPKKDKCPKGTKVKDYCEDD